MGEIDKILDKKVIDDHLKRLFDQYKTNTKIFSATHIGHISLSIVFLISILFPSREIIGHSVGNDRRNNSPRRMVTFQCGGFFAQLPFGW